MWATVTVQRLKTWGGYRKKIISIPIVPLALLKDANESFSYTMCSLLADKRLVDVMISVTAILRCANMKKEFAATRQNIESYLICGVLVKQAETHLL